MRKLPSACPTSAVAASKRCCLPPVSTTKMRSVLLDREAVREHGRDVEAALEHREPLVREREIIARASRRMGALRPSTCPKRSSAESASSTSSPRYPLHGPRRGPVIGECDRQVGDDGEGVDTRGEGVAGERPDLSPFRARSTLRRGLVPSPSYAPSARRTDRQK
jgi:hypothetical protein